VQIACGLVSAGVVFWHSGVVAVILVSIGMVLIRWGLDVLHEDRKRGALWMETQTINTDYTVYSDGILLFPTGMFLWAWGLSIPLKS